jgi:hypothetical protein
LPELRVLSLGWGVQSFTLAAMSALGELPKLDVLIHADTSWERQATYEFAAKWQPWLESKGMLVVSALSLSARRPQVNRTNINIPAYFRNEEGKVGQINRQCTGAWKVFIVKQLIRQEMAIRGIKLGSEVVEQWLGISWDEATRARSSQDKYIKIRWPFLEKETRMRRGDCIKWLLEHGLEVPHKSSCTHCAYHNQKDWEEQKRDAPLDWAQSVVFDNSIRNLSTKRGRQLFVHRSTKPLSQAVFLPEEAGYSQSFLPMDGPGCDTAGYCWD